MTGLQQIGKQTTLRTINRNSKLKDRIVIEAPLDQPSWIIRPDCRSNRGRTR